MIVASSGILFGLLSGSLAIVFDGLFSVIDVAILMLALAVARLVQREGDRRFQHGYWHIEPIVLAFNGSVLMFLCLYAFINAVGSLLAGGRELALDWAIGYAAGSALVTFSMYFHERKENRRIQSEFLRLDAQSWLMSALISSALLVAFVLAWWQQQRWQWRWLGLTVAIVGGSPWATQLDAEMARLHTMRAEWGLERVVRFVGCLLYTSPSPRD